MTAATDLFVQAAQEISVLDGYRAAGGELVPKRGQAEITGPCIHAGGTDGFSINPGKDAWNCRKCGYGGRDGLSIAAHELGFDLKSRTQFLECCSVVTGLPVPDADGGESDVARAQRLAVLEARRLEAAQAEAERQAAQSGFRERERAKAAGIYQQAIDLVDAAEPDARDYLLRRCAAVPPGHWLRLGRDVTYWHGQDERGQPVAVHSGPAIVSPFVSIADDLSFDVIGCHITWLDLARPPKLRPVLYALTAEGLRARRETPPDARSGWRPSADDLAAGHYEMLPTKKMRGTKKGGLMPIAGDPSWRRWLGGEGIENVVAVAGAEGFRADTFYFAAGDLGNLAGPALAASRFAHPDVTKPDKNGRQRPVMVPGPVPDPARLDDGFPILPHVRECVLVADNDSERVMTAAAMARARARIAALVPNCLVPVLWPPAGQGDFSDWLGNGARHADVMRGAGQ